MLLNVKIQITRNKMRLTMVEEIRQAYNDNYVELNNADIRVR